MSLADSLFILPAKSCIHPFLREMDEFSFFRAWVVNDLFCDAAGVGGACGLSFSCTISVPDARTRTAMLSKIFIGSSILCFSAVRHRLSPQDLWLGDAASMYSQQSPMSRFLYP